MSNKELIKRQNDFVNQLTATGRDKVNKNAHVRVEISTYSDVDHTKITSSRTITFDAPESDLQVALQKTQDLEREVFELKEAMRKLTTEQ